jgi:regulator of RNase E activity RraA
MGCSVGFRVFEYIDRPPDEIIRQFARFSTPDISDRMHRSGAMDESVRPVDPVMKIAGPAITVRLPSGDNMVVYNALEICKPGDVLVMETRRSTAAAVWGDRLSRMATGAGVAGMITDGCVRDRSGIRAIGLPVFANPAQVANGAYKHGPGEVNTPVSVGGRVVLPGDLVVADADGVVVVHSTDIPSILAELSASVPQLAAQSCKRIRRKWGG